ncbi:hypothetical protein PV328_003624 [Microctonus aethiopoides]|uniref:Phosphatidic acid phosphatase type 2/haloperoxidase domain-containing protein n=1 Tax=Microctonus aethiopoides TaxID=144406 RepID=A0AA39KKQ7_9HYME|nr:hypothetical protein PV328_003624 [Microctonus aethiopoides]
MTMKRSLNISINFGFDVLLRVILAILAVMLEKSEPFNRKIQDDELWLYRNPKTESYVPTTILWPLVIITPIVVITLTFLSNKDKIDFGQATLAVTLALNLNGILTNIIKIIVGRPRPDYLSRCFPDGHITSIEFDCTGDPDEVRDGKKSFPSGHSSFAFASFGFIALYLAGKLKTFSLSGKSQSWTLCGFFMPLLFALCIALSRTCDYHHHWQDVAVGSTIGFLISYMCYRHYYPPLDSHMCHKPYAVLIKQGEIENSKGTREDQIKWI